MITVQVPELVLRESSKVCDQCNFGRRGFDDGNKVQQLHGIIAQNSIALAFGFPFVSMSDMWDGGFDFKLMHEKIDVKSVSRTVAPQPHYEARVISDQLRYDVQIYLFTSYNHRRNELTICGWLTKDLFMQRARRYKRGDVITRDDGSSFVCRLDTHQIYYHQLNGLADSLEQLKEDIEIYSLLS